MLPWIYFHLTFSSSVLGKIETIRWKHLSTYFSLVSILKRMKLPAADTTQCVVCTYVQPWTYAKTPLFFYMWQASARICTIYSKFSYSILTENKQYWKCPSSKNSRSTKWTWRENECWFGKIRQTLKREKICRSKDRWIFIRHRSFKLNDKIT